MEKKIFFRSAKCTLCIISWNLQTLWKVLYLNIENGHFLVGVNNLDLFMTELYQVWLLSSYNPDELLPDDDLKGKDDNKPIAINYKSSTALCFLTIAIIPLNLIRTRL
ncbi:hypothetical protein OKW96_09955 [Sphingobacterium sp. KU25419]|nr:hypothetical protein OKW96_09955 [Sphingobacterium sp. KU25419]